jgi:hypothetical protein
MTAPNTAPPEAATPPSTRRFVRSLAIVVLVAAAIIVTTVLPAELGRDPTGVGALLGLKEMGEIKMQLAAEAAADSIDENAPRLSVARLEAGMMFDSIDVTLPPGAGREVKLVMRKDAQVRYAWSANRGVVNYDTHADAPTIRYHGYGKGSAAKSDSGTLVAAFDGSHGWFWRNRGTDTVVVTLRTTGHYDELKRLP